MATALAWDYDSAHGAVRHLFDGDPTDLLKGAERNVRDVEACAEDYVDRDVGAPLLGLAEVMLEPRENTPNPDFIDDLRSTEWPAVLMKRVVSALPHLVSDRSELCHITDDAGRAELAAHVDRLRRAIGARLRGG